MSLKFFDGFDHYATADITAKWTARANATIDATAGRRGGGAVKTTGSTNYINKTVAAASTLIIGFAFNYDGVITGAGYILYLGDGGSDQCGLYLNADGTISFRRATTTLATSATALSASTWNYIELRVTIHDTTGAYEVRLNGTNILSASSVDTKNTANATANSIWLNGRPGGSGGGGVNAGSSSGIFFDDFYYCDDTGSTNNNFLGDCRVDAYLPNGNGNSSQLTGSDGNSTDNYLHVDESAPDGDTSYVESATAGQKDTYAMADMTHTPSSIFGVQVLADAKKDDAGLRSIATVTRSGGTDYDGATQGLSTSYAYYSDIREVDPNTSAAWTKTNFNAAQHGVKVAA